MEKTRMTPLLNLIKPKDSVVLNWFRNKHYYQTDTAFLYKTSDNYSFTLCPKCLTVHEPKSRNIIGKELQCLKCEYNFTVESKADLKESNAMYHAIRTIERLRTRFYIMQGIIKNLEPDAVLNGINGEFNVDTILTLSSSVFNVTKGIDEDKDLLS